jgi:hypothetical protein
MDDATLRAWWSHRQGLDGSLAGKSPAEVLERSGWARSVAGIGPYLTLFSRGGITRQAADDAVGRVEICELPTARGCTYVVPASAFAIGLKVGETFGQGELKTAAKLGVTDKEIEKLCDTVIVALSKGGTLDPDTIREATGKASRSLGEEGKKKGLTTTLPLALGLLQARGDIRRVPVNGRLDQQRYCYTLWKQNPLAKYKGTLMDAYREMARRYFRWVGPATLGELQWFAGLGAKVTKEVAEPLGLVPAEPGSERLLLPDDVDAYRSFKAPNKPQYVLVSSLDTISAARRDVRGLLDAKDHDRKLPIEKGTAAGSSVSDLPAHAILDRGRLIGLWQYDVESQSIVYGTFGVKDKALDVVVQATESYVRDQVGDARSFSLDSPKSRVSKIEAIREIT